MDSDIVNLFEHIDNLQRSKSLCDVIFKYWSHEEKQVWLTLGCHRSVLAALSPVLRDCMEENADEETVIICEWGREVVDLLYRGTTVVTSKEKGLLLWNALADLGIDANTSILPIEQSQQSASNYTELVRNTSHLDVIDGSEAKMEEDVGEGEVYYFIIGETSTSTSTKANGEKEAVKSKSSRKSELKPRESSYSNSNVNECGDCKETFYSDVSLSTHYADYHLSISCDECDVQCKGVMNFINHKLLHSPSGINFHSPSRLNCQLCGNAFVTNQALKYHQYKHAGVRPYKCTACKENFRTPSTLKGHFLVQHSTSKHKCSVCGQYSSTSGKLRIHMRTHTQEKPYRCKHCSLAFKHNSVLRIHEFTHTNTSQFKCPKCLKCFPIKSKFVQHVNRPRCDEKVRRIEDSASGRKYEMFPVDYLVEDTRVESIENELII